MAKNTSSDYISRISREFGLYTLDKRAIPAMSDGLKSGQRTALWLMRHREGKLKTMALAGQMIASELYVHGDTSAADAISMLAGPYCNNRPLFHGIGAFGTRAEPVVQASPHHSDCTEATPGMQTRHHKELLTTKQLPAPHQRLRDCPDERGRAAPPRPSVRLGCRLSAGHRADQYELSGQDTSQNAS